MVGCRGSCVRREEGNSEEKGRLYSRGLLLPRLKKQQYAFVPKVKRQVAGFGVCKGERPNCHACENEVRESAKLYDCDVR